MGDDLDRPELTDRNSEQITAIMVHAIRTFSDHSGRKL
jgi:hypothetical protein